jgi:hypothetical protein
MSQKKVSTPQVQQQARVVPIMPAPVPQVYVAGGIPTGVARQAAMPDPMPTLNFSPSGHSYASKKQILDLHWSNIQKGLEEGVLSHQILLQMYSPPPLANECHVTWVHGWIYKNMLNIVGDAAGKYPDCPARQLMYALETAFKAGMQSGANYMYLKNEVKKEQGYGKSVKDQIALTKADFITPAMANEPVANDDMGDLDEFLQLDAYNNNQ